MVALQVHLWTRQDGAKSEIPASALAMVTDLLAVSGGVTEEGPTGAAGSLAASFHDAVLAIKTARQLHRLIRGYCSALPAGSMGAVITLSSNAEPPVQIDVPLLLQTQALGAPGQVLVAGALSESVRAIPGLQFQPLSGGMVSLDGRGSPREVLHLLPPVDLGEMLYEPIATGPVRVEAPADGALVEAMDSASMVADTGVDAAPSGPSTGAGELVGIRGRSVDAPVERRFPMMWVVTGCVAVIVIVAVGFFLSRGPKRTITVDPPAIPTATNEKVAPGGSTSGSKPGSGVVVDPSPPPEKPPVTAATTPVNPKTKVKPGTGKKVAETNPGDEADEAKKEPSGKTAGLFTAADINGLIAKGDRDSGNGNYDRAILEYETALKYDPNNTAARAGKLKAIHNRDSR